MKKIKKTQLQIIASWLVHHPKDMDKIVKTDKIAMILGLVLCFSLLFNGYQMGHPSQAVLVTDMPGVSGVKNDSQKKALFSLSKPINSLPIVENWITQASQNIFSFDFTNIDEHYAQIRPYFTSNGWESFQTAMNDEYSIKNSVIKDKNIAKAVTTSKAVLAELPSDEAVDKTSKHWVMQVPMLITLSSGNRSVVIDRVFEFDIIEDPSSLYGRGIESIKTE